MLLIMYIDYEHILFTEVGLKSSLNLLKIAFSLQKFDGYLGRVYKYGLAEKNAISVFSSRS